MKKTLMLLVVFFLYSTYAFSQLSPSPGCDNLTLGINHIEDSSNHNIIHFTAIADSSIFDQLWSVSKLSSANSWASVTLHKPNPVYEFLDSGYYKVCVHVLFKNYCKKDFCDYITILSPSSSVNSCSLQLYPNPATVVVNTSIILNEPLLIHAALYNSLNVLIMSKDVEGNTGTNTITFNIAPLVAGNYYMKLAYGNNICTKSFGKE